MNNPNSSAPNPYEAPTAPAQIGESRHVEVGVVARPLAVTIAIAIIATFTAFVAYGGIKQIAQDAGDPLVLAFEVAVAVAVSVGLSRGARLAWHWARIVGVLFVAALVMSLSVAFANSSAPWFGRNYAIGTVVVGFFTVAPLVLLSLPSSLVFFRLVCPSCRRRTTTAADFLFRRAKCMPCGVTF
jgi:hypothetical protein